jgi:uncharacterized protein YjiS (DUF1127 family)
MTYFFSDATLADLGIRDAIKAALRRAVAAAWAANARRRVRQEYRHLLTCEDHLLADAGLTRGEIRRALRARERR